MPRKECCVDLKNSQHRKRSLILNDIAFFLNKYPQSSIKYTCHNLHRDEFNFYMQKPSVKTCGIKPILCLGKKNKDKEYNIDNI